MPANFQEAQQTLCSYRQCCAFVFIWWT